MRNLALPGSHLPVREPGFPVTQRWHPRAHAPPFPCPLEREEQEREGRVGKEQGLRSGLRLMTPTLERTLPGWLLPHPVGGNASLTLFVT